MGAALRLVGSRKYSEGKTASKASQKIQQRVRKGKRTGRAESKARLRWKESKSHWQEQTSSENELRCQEDGKGPRSCCYCSMSESSCSAEKPGAGGPQFTLLPSVGFSGECPKGSTFPPSARLRPCSGFSCLTVRGGSPDTPVPDVQPWRWGGASPEYPFAFYPSTPLIFKKSASI